MGKGSKRRPLAVDSKTFEDNWELAFRQEMSRLVRENPSITETIVHQSYDLAVGPDHSVERPVYIGLVTAEDRKPPEDTQ